MIFFLSLAAIKDFPISYYHLIQINTVRDYIETSFLTKDYEFCFTSIHTMQVTILLQLEAPQCEETRFSTGTIAPKMAKL